MGRPKKIGILTAGGDCPGLNAALRGVGKTAILKYGMEVVGISSGFLGFWDCCSATTCRWTKHPFPEF